MAENNNNNKDIKYAEKLSEAAEDAAKGIGKVDSAVKSLKTRAIDALNKSFGRLKKTTDDASTSQKALTKELKATTQLEKAMGMSLKLKEKSLLAVAVSMEKYGAQTRRASREMDALSTTIEEASEEYKHLRSEIIKNDFELRKLEKQGKLTAEKQQELTEKIALQRTALSATEHQLVTATEAYQTWQSTVIESRNAALANAKAIAVQAAEYDQLEGGLKGVSGTFKKMAAERYFNYIEWVKNGGAVALFAISLAKLNQALAETADYLKATRSVTLSLGQDMNSMGGVSEAFAAASNTAAKLRGVSADLGVKFEDLAEAATKVRLGIRVDRNGQLLEDQISSLTVEAARFSKVAGIELGTAVDMLDKRMKRFGMTSQEATNDFYNMRVALGQMSAGNKANTVSIGEMVEIIEEASSASQSYIVDTRIMTQALRGAVNQAQLLGASQKESKDIAKATAKVFGSAPDWIKIPAGHNLMSQLLGADSDKFISKFNRATQDRLRSLKNAVRSGDQGMESASRELFDLIGNTEVGMDAQFSQLKLLLFDVDQKTGRLLRRNNNASLTVMKEYSIESQAVANMMTRMLQDSAELQQDMFDEALKTMSPEDAKAYVQKVVPLSTSLAKQTATFNDSISTALRDGKDAIELLVKQGMSKDKAEEYFKFYQANAQKAGDYEKQRQAIIDDNYKSEFDKQNELAMLRKKHFTEYTQHQLKMIKLGTDPVAALLDRLSVDGEAVEIDVSQFKKVGIENADDLAKTLGIANQAQKDELKKVWDAGGKFYGEQMRTLVNASSTEAEKQRAALEATYNKFADGFIPGLQAMFHKYVSELEIAGVKIGGPLANVLTSGITMLGGLLVAFFGGILLKRIIKEGTKEGVEAAIGGSGKGDAGDIADMFKDTKGFKGKVGRLLNNKNLRRLAGVTGMTQSASYFAQSGGVGEAFSNAPVEATYESMKGLAGGLSLLGGKVGAIAGAFSIGVQAGEMLNKVFNALGLTGESTIDAIQNFSEKFDFLSGLMGIKSDDEKKKHDDEGILAGRRLTNKNFNLTDEEGELYRKKAKEKGMSLRAYMTSIGRLPNQGALMQPTAAVVVPPASAITGMETAMNIPSGPPTPSAPPTANGAANVGATQIAEAMRYGGNSALKELVARPQFGGVSPDGSLNLRIENFINVLSDVKQTAARANVASIKP